MNSNLFDVINDAFFNVLTGANKRIYIDCIFLLNKLFIGKVSFGVERTIIVEIFSDYLESENGNSFIDEESDKSYSAIAHRILRRLKECGWIEEEITNDYKQETHLTDHAIAIIQTLEDLKSNKRLEYQGLVYQIYALLHSDTLMEENIIVMEVFSRTIELINGLKNLNSNIKKYIDQSTKYKDPKEILELHFVGYTSDIIDRAYHRLKTSDNVSKFRPKIIEKLETYLGDSDFVNQAATLEMKYNESTENEAKGKIIDNLIETIGAFNRIDEIITTIDKRNAQYIKASFNRVNYLINSSKNLEGKINELLKHLAEKVIKENLVIHEDYIDEFEKLYSVYHQGFVDIKSIYEVKQGSKGFKTSELKELRNVSEEEKIRRKLIAKKKTIKKYSRSKVNEYVLEQLGDKKAINGSDFPLDNTHDYLNLIYTLVYAKSRFSKYKLIRKNKEIKKNKYTFNEFEVRRK